MAIICPVRGILPTISPDCFLAPNATVVGEVSIGKSCSVWFGAVVRGDVNPIVIGDRTNIQDGAVIHCTYKKTSTFIGNDVSIGHNAIVHGCKIEDGVLIGMGAIVMDHAHIGAGAVIAAGAVVLENTVVEPGYIYAGIPAKKIKPVSQQMREHLLQTALNYIEYAKWIGPEQANEEA